MITDRGQVAVQYVTWHRGMFASRPAVVPAENGGGFFYFLSFRLRRIVASASTQTTDMVLVTAAPTSFSPSETSGGILPTSQRGLLPLQEDVPPPFCLNRVNEPILNEPQTEPRLAALLWLYALLR